MKFSGDMRSIGSLDSGSRQEAILSASGHTRVEIASIGALSLGVGIADYRNIELL